MTANARRSSFMLPRPISFRSPKTVIEIEDATRSRYIARRREEWGYHRRLAKARVNFETADGASIASGFALRQPEFFCADALLRRILPERFCLWRPGVTGAGGRAATREWDVQEIRASRKRDYGRLEKRVLWGGRHKKPAGDLVSGRLFIFEVSDRRSLRACRRRRTSE